MKGMRGLEFIKINLIGGAVEKTRRAFL